MQEVMGGRGNLSDVDTGSYGLASTLLHAIDEGEQILQFRVWLAKNSHPAQISNVTVVVATRIQGNDVPRIEALLGRGAVQAGPGGDQAVFESEPAVYFLRA